MFGREPRRTEHGHARANEMEVAEASHDLPENANCPSQFVRAFLRPLQELRDLLNWWRLTPVGCGRSRPRLGRADCGVRVLYLAHRELSSGSIADSISPQMLFSAIRALTNPANQPRRNLLGLTASLVEPR